MSARKSSRNHPPLLGVHLNELPQNDHGNVPSEFWSACKRKTTICTWMPHIQDLYPSHAMRTYTHRLRTKTHTYACKSRTNMIWRRRYSFGFRSDVSPSTRYRGRAGVKMLFASFVVCCSIPFTFPFYVSVDMEPLAERRPL